MSVIDNICTLLETQNKTQKDLCDFLGISNVRFTDWKVGRLKSYKKHLPEIASFFGITVEQLLSDNPTTKSNAVFLDNSAIRLVPLYESVSAGFGSMAVDSVIEYIPMYIADESEATETLCLKVHGDSMYPKIEDGDIIQVHKQTSVDSGSIAVILLDGEEGFVKKVVYGADWIELHSLNPMYPTQRFDGPAVLRLQVVGLVRKIIKSV